MRPSRVDANQPEIVEALRAAGILVAHTHMVGNGFPDLVVWNPINKRLRLIEVKMLGAGLNTKEASFHRLFGEVCCVVHSADEAMMAMRE